MRTIVPAMTKVIASYKAIVRMPMLRPRTRMAKMKLKHASVSFPTLKGLLGRNGSTLGMSKGWKC